MTDRLEAFLEELRGFVRERDWRKFHDPKNLSMLIASEAGELAAVLRWTDNGEADAAVAEEPLRTRLAHEAADVLIGALLLCDRMGLDPIALMREKLDKNRRNYPADAVRGSADRPKRG
jgi:dCTP diphosphatase